MQKIVSMEDKSLDERINALDNEKQVMDPSDLDSMEKVSFEIESQTASTRKACCVVF